MHLYNSNSTANTLCSFITSIGSFVLPVALALTLSAICPQLTLGQQRRDFSQTRAEAARLAKLSQETQQTQRQLTQRLQNQTQPRQSFQGKLFLTPTHQAFRQSSSQRGAVSEQRTLLYFFTSHGCAPCKQVEPVIEVLKGEGYPVETVYLGNDPASSQRYMREFGVTHTPTVVLISGGQLQGRHKGIDIDAVTLKKWFELVGVPSGTAFASDGNAKSAGGTKVVLSEEASPQTGTSNRLDDNWSSLSSFAKSGVEVAGNFSTPTMIKGTARPANVNEQRAMQATVRLRVEDPEGISFATGTVVHNHEGECLVMTCGHVFRDAGGKGVITAEYGFETGNPKTAPGELIYYDAKARDIGLVSIKTNSNIVPVPIADRKAPIARGQNIFSIGCDHGASPTIRRSRIKNKAAYDGAVKYDIFGRPVDGRSGGGLFTADGELIGVCNAAAVEVDEGIYTALDTIYWQIAEVNLNHLFNGQATPSSPVPARLASSQNAGGRRDFGSNNATWQEQPPVQNGSDSTRGFNRGAIDSGRLAAIQPRSFGSSAAANRRAGQTRTPVRWDDRSASQPGQSASYSDREVIIIVRSKNDPSHAEAITVSDPTPELLNYLDNMQSNNSKTRHLDMARLRTVNRK